MYVIVERHSGNGTLKPLVRGDNPVGPGENEYGHDDDYGVIYYSREEVRRVETNK